MLGSSSQHCTLPSPDHAYVRVRFDWAHQRNGGKNIGFPDFPDNADLGNFPMTFRGWEGLQSMGNGCWLQMDGFSSHFEPSGSISVDFHDFDNFAVISGGLKTFKKLTIRVKALWSAAFT